MKKHIPDTNVDLLNNETVTLKNRFDILSTNSNKFIERTGDEEMITQSMTKIKEDLILRSQKITFVLEMLKQFLVTECTQVRLSARRKYVLFETVILHVLA